MPYLKFHLVVTLMSLVSTGVAAAEASVTAQPLATVASLNVPRYMGVWYEIARYPNFFQRKCIGFTVADYRLNSDKTVQVINRCKLQSGETDQAIGVARQIGAADSPKLEVRFAPAWLSALPMVWGDYWVIDLDHGYQLAAVSDSKREYLWVLARNRQVDPTMYSALLGRLTQQGFNVQKLILTKQID